MNIKFLSSEDATDCILRRCQKKKKVQGKVKICTVKDGLRQGGSLISTN